MLRGGHARPQARRADPQGEQGAHRERERVGRDRLGRGHGRVRRTRPNFRGGLYRGLLLSRRRSSEARPRGCPNPGSIRWWRPCLTPAAVEILPPPPPDACYFDAIAKFRRARHDKEALARHEAGLRGTSRGGLGRLEENRLSAERGPPGPPRRSRSRLQPKTPRGGPRRRLPSDSSRTRERRSRQNLRRPFPRLPRGRRRRLAGARRGASACVSPATRRRPPSIGRVSTRKRFGPPRRATPRPPPGRVGAGLSARGRHEMAAALGSVAKNVVNASVNGWRAVRDSDLAQERRRRDAMKFLASIPWEPLSKARPTPARALLVEGVDRGGVLEVGPGERLLKVGPRSFPDLTAPMQPARRSRLVSGDEARRRAGPLGAGRAIDGDTAAQHRGGPRRTPTPARSAHFRYAGWKAQRASVGPGARSLRTREFTLVFAQVLKSCVQTQYDGKEHAERDALHNPRHVVVR